MRQLPQINISGTDKTDEILIEEEEEEEPNQSIVFD